MGLDELFWKDDEDEGEETEYEEVEHEVRQWKEEEDVNQG